MATLSYKCLVVFYATEYMLFFPRKVSTVSTTTVPLFNVKIPVKARRSPSKNSFFPVVSEGCGLEGRSKGSIERKHVTGCYQLFILFFSFLFRLPSGWFLWSAQHEKMAKPSPSSCLLVTILRTNNSHAHGTCPKNKSLSAAQNLDIIPTSPKRLPSTNGF